MMYVELMKNFLLADSSELIAVRLISALSSKTSVSYFLDMIYVVFMKNFLLSDSSELVVVRLTSASWGKKRLIPTFLTWCTSSWWKIFFSPIRANFWLLDSFRPPGRRNVWLLLSGHDVRRVVEKFSSRRSERTFGCKTHFGLLSPKTFDSYFLDKMYVEFMKNFLLADSGELMVLDSFRSPEPENVWFSLSRHDVRRVDEKFSSRRFERADGCYTHFCLLRPKAFDSYFLDLMYVEMMKNFHLADSSELLTVRLLSTSLAQKRLIPTF